MFTDGIQQGMGSVVTRIQSILARFTPPEAPTPTTAPNPGQFQALVQQAASRYGLSPSLLDKVIATESNFNPQAVSSAGAMGLMQLMPATAAELGVTDPFNPAQNVDAGARYLRSLLNRFGSLPLALAAYNAGPSAVQAAGGIPSIPETQAYVQRILGSNLDNYG